MFARTERLILRPSWPEDATALAQALGNPDIARNMTHEPSGYDAAEAHRWIERSRDPRLPEFLAFLRTRGASRLVGGAGIVERADGALELAYWVERSHWGLGFATEATRAVMRVARSTGLMGVRAAHFLDNPSSARVLRKLGFRPTGRVESRLSRARASEVPTALFEYDEASAPPREDAASILYKDAMLALT